MDKKKSYSLKLISLEIKALIGFNIISSILTVFCATILIIFTPFFAGLIRHIASSLGYGSAKRLYFIVEYFDFFSYVVGILFLIIASLFLIASYGYMKLKHWGKTIHTLVWSLTLIIIPIGTILGLYALWLSSNVNLKSN